MSDIEHFPNDRWPIKAIVIDGERWFAAIEIAEAPYFNEKPHVALLHWDEPEQAVYRVAESIKSPRLKRFDPAMRIWGPEISPFSCAQMGEIELTWAETAAIRICRELLKEIAKAHHRPFDRAAKLKRWTGDELAAGILLDSYNACENAWVADTKKLIDRAIDSIVEASRIHHLGGVA